MYERNLREINELIAQKKPPHVVGLTGGIASGKTVATAALAAVGFKVIDADEISREMFGKGTDGEKLLSSLFPAAARADGTLDRKKLRRMISENADARKTLNDATHPQITKKIAQLISNLNGEKVVLSAPLLFESGLSSLCDCTVCVTCPTRIRIERLTKRDGVTKNDAEKMIAAQIPDTYRATLADFCVPSDRDIEKFKAEIIELFQALCAIPD